VGSLIFKKQDECFGARSLIVGNPAKKIKEVNDEMIAWKTEGTKLYKQLPQECHNFLKPCEPLQKLKNDEMIQAARYKPFKAK
jgi:phenylacetic acid degradation protein